jgi:hypothetical protein
MKTSMKKYYYRNNIDFIYQNVPHVSIALFEIPTNVSLVRTPGYCIEKNSNGKAQKVTTYE